VDLSFSSLDVFLEEREKLLLARLQAELQ